jgi:hypothetical protein
MFPPIDDDSIKKPLLRVAHGTPVYRGWAARGRLPGDVGSSKLARTLAISKLYISNKATPAGSSSMTSASKVQEKGTPMAKAGNLANALGRR